ncbi:MAG TPA: aminopeptidase P N-terminal domain-containing protein, partial [Bdellovibrionales bacterium]|nr:aminopeptidase P N-terminal domain-containing protein [Bdellovibrionales bacterium]
MRRPTIDPGIFKKRRERLAAQTQGAAVIVPAHPELIRNHDVHFPYRQDSHLYYLTGFEEPESVLVLRPGMTPEYVLFVRKKDVHRETWDGFRYGPEGAEREFGVDKAYPFDEIDKVLPTLLEGVEKVYYRLYWNTEFDGHLQRALESVRIKQGRSGTGLLPIIDSSEILGEMRLKKEPIELEWLRRACEISAEGHVAAMKFTHPGVNERQVQAVVEYTFRMHGSPRDGYGSIVASGASATTLHYVFNDQPCKEGDLLLIDAGAEYNHFTGDITRTFPVSGRFTDVQTRFYEKVLQVQKAILKMIRPGIAFKSMQDTTIEMLTDALLELGILKGSANHIIEQQLFKKYYPHGVSHWLGMDVHDCGLYKIKGESRRLEPGMCFTVEPGLYVPLDDQDAPKEFRGLGVRIEDDVVVTDLGCEVMTSKAPKEIHDMASIIGKG